MSARASVVNGDPNNGGPFEDNSILLIDVHWSSKQVIGGVRGILQKSNLVKEFSQQIVYNRVVFKIFLTTNNRPDYFKRSRTSVIDYVRTILILANYKNYNQN